METRCVLALDLGSNVGWAMKADDKPVVYGTEEFRPGRFEGGGMRYVRFGRWLTELHNLEPVTEVYFEEVRRHVGTTAAHVYGGFLAHLTAWCEAHKVPYQGIPVGTIKKSATGRGNASKDEMIAAMEQLGYRPDDDNAADALAILEYVTKTTQAVKPRRKNVGQ